MFNETNIWQNHSTACYDIKRSNSTMSTAKPQSTTITLYFTHPTILIRSSLSITFLIISPRGVAKSQLIRPFAQQNKELPLLLGDWRLTTPTASLSPRFSLSRSARYNASAAYSGEKPWHAAGGQENRFSFRPHSTRRVKFAWRPRTLHWPPVGRWFITQSQLTAGIWTIRTERNGNTWTLVGEGYLDFYMEQFKVMWRMSWYF